MKISPAVRFVSFGLAASWLAVGLAWAGLLIELAQSDGLVRYPGAVRLTAPEFRLDSLPDGYIRQSVIYQTADTWTGVFRWYARRLKVNLDRRPQLKGDCIQFTDTDDWLIIRQSIGVTLCSRAAGTTVFINRHLALLR